MVAECFFYMFSFFGLIAMVGKTYFTHRIHALEQMDTAKADDEIVRITRFCEGGLLGWLRKFVFFVEDVTVGYQVHGRPDASVVASEPYNDKEYATWIQEGGGC